MASGSDDMFAIDWGAPGYECYALWKVEPCCADVGSCIYCCLCFYFCGPCTLGKLFAYSVKQDCALVNHCLPACCLGLCTAIATRHNLRTHIKVGDTTSTMGWIGDCLIVWCCGCCALAQMVRAVPKDAWDWFPHWTGGGNKISVDPCKFVEA